MSFIVFLLDHALQTLVTLRTSETWNIQHHSECVGGPVFVYFVSCWYYTNTQNREVEPAQGKHQGAGLLLPRINPFSSYIVVSSENFGWSCTTPLYTRWVPWFGFAIYRGYTFNGRDWPYQPHRPNQIRIKLVHHSASMYGQPGTLRQLIRLSDDDTTSLYLLDCSDLFWDIIGLRAGFQTAFNFPRRKKTTRGDSETVQTCGKMILDGASPGWILPWPDGQFIMVFLCRHWPTAKTLELVSPPLLSPFSAKKPRRSKYHVVFYI